MCKKKKEVAKKGNPFDNFELKKQQPTFDENGKRDYFTEYYNAYKNNYIDQYLEAYKKFKEEGYYSDSEPYIPIVNENAENNEYDM